MSCRHDDDNDDDDDESTGLGLFSMNDISTSNDDCNISPSLQQQHRRRSTTALSQFKHRVHTIKNYARDKYNRCNDTNNSYYNKVTGVNNNNNIDETNNNYNEEDRGNNNNNNGSSNGGTSQTSMSLTNDDNNNHTNTIGLMFRLYGPLFIIVYIIIDILMLCIVFTGIQIGILDPISIISTMTRISSTLATGHNNSTSSSSNNKTAEEEEETGSSSLSSSTTTYQFVTEFMKDHTVTRPYTYIVENNPFLANLVLSVIVVRFTQPIRLMLAIYLTPKLARFLSYQPTQQQQHLLVPQAQAQVLVQVTENIITTSITPIDQHQYQQYQIEEGHVVAQLMIASPNSKDLMKDD